MNWMPKARSSASSARAGAATATAAARPGPTNASGLTRGTSAPPTGVAGANTRVSNGLKEFLWLLGDIRGARILDLGPVWQATVTFLTEKGFRLSTEDLLRSWKEFLTEEEERLRVAPAGENGDRCSPEILADRFLETALQYPEESIHGVLAWDLLDYFDAALLGRIMERLYTIMRPDGAVLALFHSRPAQRYQRYRLVDGQSIESLPAPTLAVHAHVFQNREILDLFGKFRTSKTFVGRDQLREALFLK